VIAIVFFYVFKNLCVHCITVKGLKLTDLDFNVVSTSFLAVILNHKSLILIA
jgi:hypothetical protein